MFDPLVCILLHTQCILDLLALRQKHGLDCRAKVTVRKAAGEAQNRWIQTWLIRYHGAVMYNEILHHSQPNNCRLCSQPLEVCCYEGVCQYVHAQGSRRGLTLHYSSHCFFLAPMRMQVTCTLPPSMTPLPSRLVVVTGAPTWPRLRPRADRPGSACATDTTGPAGRSETPRRCAQDTAVQR